LHFVAFLLPARKIKQTKTPKTNYHKPKTGTNTFGCLVNGKVYIPKGYTNPYTNYRVFVDPSNNGNFDKQTYSYQNSIQMQLGINSFGINSIGIYNLTNSQIYPYYKQDVNNNTCRFIISISNFKE